MEHNVTKYDATSYDPAWSTSINSRNAVLWLGSNAPSLLADNEALSDLLELPWQAIFAVNPLTPVMEARAALRGKGRGSKLRIITEDPAFIEIGNESAPVYCLHGLESAPGSVGLSALQSQRRYLNMLTKVPAHQFLFCIGLDGDKDLKKVSEGIESSASPGKAIISSELRPLLDDRDLRIPEVILWNRDESELISSLRQQIITTQTGDAYQLRLFSDSGYISVNLSDCEQPGNLVLDKYSLITESDLSVAGEPSSQDLEDFLTDPTNSWKPYSLGIPCKRGREYEDNLLKLLRKALEKGKQASATAYIEVESGSGSTTLIRQISHSAALEGYPVLVAHQDLRSFDTRQLDSFIRLAEKKIKAQANRILPWLIVYDSPNLMGDFSTICQLGRKLARPVIILVALPHTLNSYKSDLWQASPLGQELRNRVTLSEAVDIGEHFSKILRPEQRRNKEEWAQFIAEVSRNGPHGTESLFWIALRFWLLRTKGANEPLKNWLARLFDEAVGDNQLLRASLLEIAAVSNYRLALPLCLISREARPVVLDMANNKSNPISLERFRGSKSYEIGFSHPLIGAELIRIAENSHESLASIDKNHSYSIHDIELTLFQRLLSRKEAGKNECSDFITELSSTALRVDQFELPRNYEERDRIVQILESVPDPVFDSNPIFLHRLAIARRHLAAKPPHSELWWTKPENVREQFELAESHIKVAINITTLADDPIEPLDNLFTTLGRIYEQWSEFESSVGDKDRSLAYEEAAERAYLSAEQFNPDNIKLINTLANRYLKLAQKNPGTPDSVRMLVDAISLYGRVLATESRDNRDETLQHYALALNLLKDGSGKALLDDMMARGEESAFIAAAQIRYAESNNDPSELRGVIALLQKIEGASKSWRSYELLYTVLSTLEPFNFNRRLELLDSLSTTEFAWPLQKLLERTILSHQTGDHATAEKLYRTIRKSLQTRNIRLSIPEEMKFLMDPVANYQNALRTNATIVETSRVGDRMWAVPEGWQNYKVQLRPHLFPYDSIKSGQEVPCCVQFTFYGPEVVPETELQ